MTPCRPLGELRALCLGALLRNGLPPAAAEAVTDHVLDAEACGHPSHGLASLPSVVRDVRDGLLDAAAVARVDTDGVRVSVRLDRSIPMWSLPPVLGDSARLAARHGHSLTTFDDGRSTGRLASYVEPLADAGLVGLMAVGSLYGADALVSHPQGRERVLGTNPLALAVPTADGVLVVDTSTAPATMGGVRLARLLGADLPAPVLRDRAGAPGAAPAALYDGGSVAAPDLRSFLLGLLVAVLAASGGAAGPSGGGNDGPPGGGDGGLTGGLVLAVRPAPELVPTLSAGLARLTAGQPGFRVPGALNRQRRLLARQRGLAVPDAVLDRIRAL